MPRVARVGGATRVPSRLADSVPRRRTLRAGESLPGEISYLLATNGGYENPALRIQPGGYTACNLPDREAAWGRGRKVVVCRLPARKERGALLEHKVVNMTQNLKYFGLLL